MQIVAAILAAETIQGRKLYEEILYIRLFFLRLMRIFINESRVTLTKLNQNPVMTDYIHIRFICRIHWIATKISY